MSLSATKKVLRAYHQHKNLRKAYLDVGVDGNTVVAGAAYAELAVAAPQKFDELLKDFSQSEKIASFNQKYLDTTDADVMEKINDLKKMGCFFQW